MGQSEKFAPRIRKLAIGNVLLPIIDVETALPSSFDYGY